MLGLKFQILPCSVFPNKYISQTCNFIQCFFSFLFLQVPRVFVDGECVGGGTDVKALHESGELSKKLGLAA